MKTLLSKQGITLTTTNTAPGQIGQTQGFASLDHQRGGCATKQQNKPWASSSARIEHQPQLAYLISRGLFGYSFFIPVVLLLVASYKLLGV